MNLTLATMAGLMMLATTTVSLDHNQSLSPSYRAAANCTTETIAALDAYIFKLEQRIKELEASIK